MSYLEDVTRILVVEEAGASSASLRTALDFLDDGVSISYVENVTETSTFSDVDLLLVTCPDFDHAICDHFRNSAVVFVGSYPQIAKCRFGVAEQLSVRDVESGLLQPTMEASLARFRSHRQMLGLIEHNVDAILVVSSENVVEYANSSAQALLSDSLVGSLCPLPVGEVGDVVEFEFRQRDENVVVEIRASTIEWGGKDAMLATARDISLRREAANLERRLLQAERLSAIGQIASGVAHEINNPCAYILGNLGYMRNQFGTLRGVFDNLAALSKQETVNGVEIANVVDRSEFISLIEEFDEIIDDNEVGTEQIVQIVRGLRNYAGIEHDVFEVISINDLVVTALRIVADEAYSQAKVVRKLADDIPAIVGDSARLSHVFVNLISNAAQAIPAGSREHNQITIETRFKNGFVELIVTDTGRGIPKEKIDAIFSPFYTTKERGKGLGLSIAKETVDKHRGAIRVSSEIGTGSRFLLSLPANNGLTPSEVEEVDSSSLYRAARILLIDDDDMVRRAYRRVLEAVHEVVDVADGRQAISLIEKGEEFDVLLCDVMMPEFDGIEIYQALEQHHPTVARRVVFLTGGAFTPRTREFVESVKAIVLEKPVAQGLLLGVIERVRTAMS